MKYFEKFEVRAGGTFWSDRASDGVFVLISGFLETSSFPNRLSNNALFLGEAFLKYCQISFLINPCISISTRRTPDLTLETSALSFKQVTKVLISVDKLTALIPKKSEKKNVLHQSNNWKTDHSFG